MMGSRTVQLRHVTRCLDGRRIPLNSEQRAEIPGEYPYWGANGVVGLVGEYLFDERLILLGEDGAPFGDPLKDVAFLVEGRVWVNNHIHVLRPLDSVDPRFLTYALNSVGWPAYITGSTREKLTQDDMNQVRVACPARWTQSAIADFLDAETARIDALIKLKLEFMVLLDEMIDSLIQEQIGAIPTLRRLRHLAKLGTGHTPDRRNSEYWENCIVPWVTAEDLSSRDNPFELLMDTHQKISTLGVAHSSAVVHPSGTVMLCRTASVGLICRIGIPMATTQAFVTWSPGPELDSGFLMYALHSLRQEWMRLAFGSTHDTIYMPDLESVKIPYVPIAEQITISRKLDTSTSHLLEAKELLNRQCKTLKERRQALITAVVTGELEIPGVAA
jgi:type I restriction enzyme S subunit